MLSPIDAFRAIYIDVEGFVDKPPALIGIACEYDFEQRVFTNSLRGAAIAQTMRMTTLESTAKELIDRCVRENRFIVAYSEHELNVCREHAGIDLSPNYRNARKIARRWINRLHAGDVTEWNFEAVLRFLGYAPPSTMRAGSATKRLRDVAGGLEIRGGVYDLLTPTQKAKWTKLLRYNRVDCLGMRDLMIRATSEMALANV